VKCTKNDTSPPTGRLWMLTPLALTSHASWLARAATRCRENACEECIAILSEASAANPASYEPNAQLGLCLSGDCRDHSQISPEVALLCLRNALARLAPSTHIRERAQILGAMGNTWVISHQGSSSSRLQAAMACFAEAARYYLALGEMDAWARQEFNLGNCCCELPENSTPDKWEHAVSHYCHALQVRTRRSDAAAYAATQENLGTAYRGTPGGDLRKNLRKAILCYRHALQVYTLLRLSSKQAGVHNNLGNAYVSLARADNAGAPRNLHRALRHYASALRVRTREDLPHDYAVTQFNQGCAFLYLAGVAPCPQPSLRSARSCFAEASDCFAHCGQPARAQAAQEQAEFACSCLGNL